MKFINCSISLVLYLFLTNAAWAQNNHQSLEGVLKSFDSINQEILKRLKGDNKSLVRYIDQDRIWKQNVLRVCQADMACNLVEYDRRNQELRGYLAQLEQRLAQSEAEKMSSTNKKSDTAVVVDSEAICDYIKENSALKDLAKISREVYELSESYRIIDFVASDHENILADEVRKAREKKWGVYSSLKDYEPSIKLGQQIDRCLLTLVDTDYAHFFIGRKESIKKFLEGRDPTLVPVIRSVDNNGNIIESKKIAIRVREDNIPMLFALKGAEYTDNILKYVIPKLIEKAEKSIKNMHAEKAREAKYKSEEQEKIKKREENARRMESPEWQLAFAYRNHNALRACNAARKGYQVIYLSDEKMREYDKDIKNIENKIKPALKNQTVSQIRDGASVDAEEIVFRIKSETDIKRGITMCSNVEAIFQSLTFKYISIK